jgi:hypothetical protein
MAKSVKEKMEYLKAPAPPSISLPNLNLEVAKQYLEKYEKISQQER